MASAISVRCLSCFSRRAVRGIYTISNTGYQNSSHAISTAPRLSQEAKGFYSSHSPKTMTEDAARALVMKLDEDSRKTLTDELKRYKENGAKSDVSSIPSLTRRESFAVFLCCGLPFVAFGIMDNTIMIFAGDAIQHHVGAYFAISTMAAAGLGNMVSDVAGVLSNAYVEKYVGRFIHIPKLTPAQTLSLRYKVAKASGPVIGVIIGCAIGMISLLFIDHNGPEDTPSSVTPLQEPLSSPGQDDQQ